MLGLIDELRELEMAKQRVQYGSAEFIRLAREAEQRSRVVFRWAGMQLQMAEAAGGAVQRGEASPEPLLNVQPRPLDRILSNWREAQIRLEIAPPGSPEATAAADEVERLREEFRAAQAQKHGMPDWSGGGS